MDGLLHLLQWPAMVAALLGSWWIGDTDGPHRRLGFIVLMTSNVLWAVWAVDDRAWALLVMQTAFLGLNGRGWRHNHRHLHAR